MRMIWNRFRWLYFFIAIGFLLLITYWHGDWDVLRTKLRKSRFYYRWKNTQVGVANATFVFLARNSEVDDVISTLLQIEDTFNSKYHYPYVFLNDDTFTEEFRKRTYAVISSSATYGLIPPDHWNQPDHIDEERASRAREQYAKDGVIYGDSVPYRNMCRFNSGFFFKHELLQKYRYYWRIEPAVDYFCHLHNDPLQFMQENGKVYGFNIALGEFWQTVRTLWETTQAFMREYPHLIHKDNAMSMVSDDGGRNYNLCHFWSNFEIADMDFWRSEAYTKFFEFLDASGGFYYERWGDAPVHSIAVSLLARKDQIHFFDEIGYHHTSYQHCPVSSAYEKGQCKCKKEDNFDYHGFSCKPRFDALFTNRTST